MVKIMKEILGLGNIDIIDDVLVGLHRRERSAGSPHRQPANRDLSRY